jgi:hypothetical protein
LKIAGALAPDLAAVAAKAIAYNNKTRHLRNSGRLRRHLRKKAFCNRRTSSGGRTAWYFPQYHSSSTFFHYL